MTRATLNGKTVRTAFEDGILYFFWKDFAEAACLPLSVVRRVPKPIRSFEKKNIKGRKKNGSAAPGLLAVSTCGLYRWVQSTDMIAPKRTVLDWIMKTYSDFCEKYGKEEDTPEPPAAQIEPEEPADSGAPGELPAEKPAGRPSRDELLGIVRENMVLLSRILEMDD